MTDLAPIRTWLAAPVGRPVSDAIERLRRAPDVRRIAIMPDVHLCADVCIGVALATSHLLYPQAVGGDIGCGMLAASTDAEAEVLRDPRVAGRILAGLTRAVPPHRRNRRAALPQPAELAALRLSHAALESARADEGVLQFATLGSGNHFLELQADEEGRLWMMVHSGSRAMGQAIREHHLDHASPVEGGLRALDADSAAGAAYLHDAEWARRYALASRTAMAEQAAEVLAREIGARVLWDTAIVSDHNHVSRENHGGADVWVHRKGAMSARLGERGVLPGSMGGPSFHVEGRGCADALCSSAHGAGRALSRTEARARVGEREFRRQMEGVWFDSRLSDRLRDEAPSAYKDVRDVLRAQRDLVKVIRTLRPLLSYKGA